VSAFYNENEPYAVEWLKNLERAGHIAPGVVESRGIQELRPKDVQEATQAHFFAGLGAWSYALRLAGWPDSVPVWSGSCPCQPFSTAGRRKGFKDERHLWPAWFELIRKCRPSVVFGEQIASPDGLRWLDLVFDDLERAGYAVGASDLCAASVGAPHIRQRLYFVAVSGEQRREGKRIHLRPRKPRQAESEVARGGKTRELGDTSSARSRRNSGTVLGAKTKGEPKRIIARGVTHEPELASNSRIVGDAGSPGSPLGPRPEERFGAVRYEGATASAPGATSGFWKEAEWWLCQDGKVRPTEPGSFPLVDGATARVGRLRAYGNAIVPEQAALFIRAAAPLIGRVGRG
jgi:DNA (cytosine-5)-methyltransferase 1